MKTDQKKFTTVDEYIESFPDDIQDVLRKVRSTIRKVAPKAEEKISYGIPTFTMNGTYLIYVAGYKNHVSLYPAPVNHPDFTEEIALYGSGKGTMKFPLNRPIPYDVVRKVVKFRLQENRAKAAEKNGKK